MSSTRYLILCAGPGSRWTGDHPVTKKPKHFAPIHGEALLHRTVRLVKQNDPEADIRVVVADLSDDRYKLPGTKRARAELTPELAGLDKVMSSRKLWNKSGRTVILFGDVFYTEAAASLICVFGGPWTLFGRPTGSRFTGKPWSEPFAFSFNPEDHASVVGAVERSRSAQLANFGKLSPSGFNHLWQAMHPSFPTERLGASWFPEEETIEYGHYVPIFDATDDLDTPDEWDRWCWGWAHATENERAEFWQ